MYFNSIYILNLTRHYYYFLIYYQYSFSFTIYLSFSLLSIPSFISMLLLGVIFLLLSKCSLKVGLLVTKSSHFYWLEMSLFCPCLLSGEAEHSWLPRWGPCRARLSWIPQAGEKVHPFFLGCERHQAKPVSDRSQRQAFDSDLGQGIRSGSGQILAGELLLAPPLTNHHLH